jgi:subtilase family serine protease
MNTKMLRFTWLALLACLFFLANSAISAQSTNASTSTSHLNNTNVHDLGDVIYNRTDVPDGWELGERASGNVLMNLTINLQPRNLDRAAELLRNISDPEHPSYGQHLSAEELSELIAPNGTVVNNVLNWLNERSLNLSEVRMAHTSLQFEANVSTIEHLFNTTIHWYNHNESGARVVVQYGNSRVPGTLRSFVSNVIGLNDFPILRQHYSVPHINIIPTPGSSTSTPGANNEKFTPNVEHTWKSNAFNHQYFAQTNLPQTLVNLYGLPDHHGFVPPSNYQSTTSHAVAQFPTTGGDQSFSPDDLISYSNEINHAWDLRVPNERIVGTNRPSTLGTEGTLDIQATMGVNPTANGWFYIVPIGAWMLEFTNTFLSRPGPLPQVVSISYGSLEETGSYYDNADANFLLMGLRGVTVVVASGDDGANQGAPFGFTCASAYATSTKLHVSWPSSSPYVLSVGATEMDPNSADYYDTDLAPICGERVPQYTTMDVGFLCTRNGTEIAASLSNSGFTSAGGFSRKYARPSWQSAAVDTFLRSPVAKPPSNYYDSSKRAVPDVAAIGSSWLIMFQQTPMLIGGTSLSAPIWAAIISMLNAETLRLNGTTLGFINPLIYQAYASDPTIFNDITSGNNICPLHKACSGCVGWTATRGWDPVTGLGSPKYSKLLAYIVNRINAGNSNTCRPSYSWRANAWSSCNGACYNPTLTYSRSRTSSCINSCTGASVADSFCSASSRPSSTESCRPTNLCYAQWSVNPTGTCSKTCGAGQLQLISTCRQSTTSTNTNINMINVNNDMCRQYTNYVPPTSQVCNNIACPTTESRPAPPTCTYSWNVGSFGSCSMGCNTPAAPAIQTRSVTCRSSCTSSGSTTTSTVADSYCTGAGAKPALTQSCSNGLRSCYADWVTEYLTECTRTCGGGTRTQYVGCWQQKGGDGNWNAQYEYASVANSICSAIQGYTPSTTVTCNPQRC